MTFHVSLVSKKIVNLYVGMAADAEAHEGDWLQPTTDTVTYSDGLSDEVYGCLLYTSISLLAWSPATTIRGRRTTLV